MFYPDLLHMNNHDLKISGGINTEGLFLGEKMQNTFCILLIIDQVGIQAKNNTITFKCPELVNVMDENDLK